MLHIVSSLEGLTSPTSALVARVHTIAPVLPLLQESLQTNRMQDVFECLDQIMDTLTIEGSSRPGMFATPEEAAAAVETHVGAFASMWSISCETRVCSHCAHTARAFIPCFTVSRISDTSTIADAFCEGCRGKHCRNVTWTLVRPGESVFVRINRHTDTGQKRHDRVCLHEGVTIGGRAFSMRAMVYHDGLTLDGGHYTCAFKSTISSAWILNSDTHVRFAGASFDISEHDAHKTYGAVYCACSVVSS